MRELWKEKKFWLVFWAEIIFVFLAIYFIFLPLAKGIVNKADRIQEAKIDRKLMADRLAKIGEARKEHEKLTGGIQKLDVLMSAEEEVDFFKELEKMAGDTGNGISIKIIEEEKKVGNASAPSIVLDKEKKEMLDGLPYKNYFVLQIGLRGGYAGLANFLHKLENSSHYLAVIAVNAQKMKEIPAGEIAPIVSAAAGQQAPEEKEILSSLITVAVYKK
jgi:hypothetical protein